MGKRGFEIVRAKLLVTPFFVIVSFPFVSFFFLAKPLAMMSVVVATTTWKSKEELQYAIDRFLGNVRRLSPEVHFQVFKFIFSLIPTHFLNLPVTVSYAC